MSLVRLSALLTACLLALGSGVSSAADAGAGAGAGAGPGASNGFPTKPVQLVVPYGPGGAVDVIGRIIADQMSQSLGQPVVVLNRPGANANIGPAFVTQAPPDGYTLLASSTATVVNPFIEKNLSWRPIDLVPVARFVQAPNILVVPASLKLNTLAEFVAHAKNNPGLSTSMAGAGAPQTIATHAFARAAGIELLDIAYKGGVSYIPDLIAGTLAVSVAPMNVVLQLVQEGKLVALANTSDRRSPLLPQVPTMAESGYPGATAVSWYGVHAPAGTPAPVVAKLAQAVRAATENAKVKERVAGVGAEMAFLDTAAFATFLAEETAKAQAFVQASGAKAKQ